MGIRRVGTETVQARSKLLNRQRNRLRFYILLVVSDAVTLSLGFSIASLVRFGDVANDQAITLVAVLLPLFLLFNKAYSPDVLRDWRSGALSSIGALFRVSAVVLFLGFYLKASTDLSRILMVTGMVSGALLIVVGRGILGMASRRVFQGAPMNHVLIADGVPITAPDGVHLLQAEAMGLSPNMSEPLLLDRLARMLDGVDSVYLACLPERRRDWAMALKGRDVHAELLMPELDSIGVIGNTHFAGIATMLVSTGPLRIRDDIKKRCFDIAMVIPTLIFLLPLLLLVALAIKLDSAGSVFFVQQRIGRGNRLFNVIKFRSMHESAGDADGRVSTTGRHDARVTRIGRLIRSTSLDELPQLLNILRGEMSFVGPRPHALGSLAGDQLFWEVDQRYWHRHVCKPGLTGLAQIRGFRGATHKREDLIKRLQADLEYVNGWSIWRDLSIIISTVRVIAHRNAF